MSEPASVTIAALGDSLTRGFQPYGPYGSLGQGVPYTDFLDNMIAAELSRRSEGRLEVRIVNLGINGDTTGGMLGRFDGQVSPLEPDHVIVLGGINDLYTGISPGSVRANLAGLYEKTRRIGATPIACTLTPVLGFDLLIPLIRGLNEMIRAGCREEGILLADLHAGMSDGEGRLIEAYSGDGVHLNGAGYERMASVVFEDAVRGILDGLGRIRSASSSGRPGQSSQHL